MMTTDVEKPIPQLPAHGIKIDVRGMTCASCSTRVQNALSALPGVEEATVNYATDMAVVRLAAGATTDLAALAGAVESAGYEVADIRDEATEAPPTERESISERRAEEAQRWRRRWIAGLILTIPIMLLQMGPHWFDIAMTASLHTVQLVSLILLTGAVVAYVGRPYVTGAWKGLRHFSANMDTLVALGAGVAFVYSTFVAILALASGGHPEVFFDGAAMILTLISVGKHLEAKARGRAGAEIEALLDLAAKHATVRRGDDWVEISATDIVVGDRMLVRPGEKIPTDGVVETGEAAVDEAMLTGESVPAHRTAGDEVVGGTINKDGRLEVRATRIGSDTVLAQIASLVERAQESKADAQRLADRVSAVFVPTIIVIAAITFVVWYLATGAIASAILPAVAVLIVACPCALGLATPTAIMVGTGRAAQRGILIREAQALEQVRKLDVIVFDKTGTLTHGRMEVTDVLPLDDADAESLVRMAASVESASEHPIARAVVEEAKSRNLPLVDPGDFSSTAGHGAAATVEGRAVRVGKPSWLDVSAEATQELEAEGKTVIAVEVDGKVSGLLALRDDLKPDAAKTVTALEQRGVEVWMITGDNETTARAIANEAGIAPERIRAGVVPARKAEAVASLQTGGRIVAMVGDGVNDAPALAHADLGIALGSGTDIAMQSAAITLVGGDLSLVSEAIRVSEAIHRKIRQNLFWAFAYNTVLVPVAAFGLLIPALAAGAMALSSVSVVTNSLLLRRTVA